MTRDKIIQPPTHFRTWIDVLRWQAQQQPTAIAQTYLSNGEGEERNLTFGQLETNARMIASALQARTKPGARALLLYPPGLDFTCAFLGSLFAGVLAVPVYPPRRGQTDTRLLGITMDAQPALVLTTQKIYEELLGQYNDLLQGAGIGVLATDRLGEGRLEDRFAGEWHQPPLADDALAFLQYTSGSTGTPKGVMVSHANLLHQAALIQEGFQFTPNSTLVSWLPEYHDMGLIGGILQPLYLGIRSVRLAPVDFLQKPIRWLQAISTYRASTSGGPNFAYELCVTKTTPEQRASLDLSSWTIAFNGAEPVRAQTLDLFSQTFEPYGFRRNAFFPCYGMAEATLMVTGNQRGDPYQTLRVDANALAEHVVLTGDSLTGDDVRTQENLLVGCGKVRSDQRLLIVDPHTRQECPPDQVGEIWLQGESVAQGYWNQPELSAEIFQARLADDLQGPFLRSGDLGFLYNDQLYITGRIKDVIIIRGRNHYPQDIELSVEQSHPALRPGCGAAFSVDLQNEERLVIAQEVDRHYLANLNVDEVAASIRRAVSEKHGLQTAAIVLLRTATIPKTSSGKIQRNACRKAFLKEKLEVVGEWRMPAVEHERRT